MGLGSQCDSPDDFKDIPFMAGGALLYVIMSQCGKLKDRVIVVEIF